MLLYNNTPYNLLSCFLLLCFFDTLRMMIGHKAFVIKACMINNEIRVFEDWLIQKQSRNEVSVSVTQNL
jgi:hypothetical protein